MAQTITQLTLALHTDLQNIANYRGNAALVSALILTAEEKVSLIVSHLMEARREAGMVGSAAIIDARAV